MMQDSNIKHKPVPFTDTAIEDGFWSPRLKTNRERTLPHIYKTFTECGRFDVYKPGPPSSCKTTYKYYWESEIAKWVEGASYALAACYDAGLDSLLDEVIGLITSVQQPDGYLNAYFTIVIPGGRWNDLFTFHELFNAGALIEAAAAHYLATGKTSLLDPVCRYANHIDAMFGREPGKKRGYCGHPGIELALVRLYRVTGNKKYLDLAWYFIDERGRQPHYFDLEGKFSESDKNWIKRLTGYYRSNNRCIYEYNQSHIPLYEQKEAVGHAVRAAYLYTAAADLAYELDDLRLFSACRELWDSVCTRKMYITGGVGSEYLIEGFGGDYDLPDREAYCETCASVGLVFWNYRMLLADCNSLYSDVIERALYNVVAASISLDGTSFFYRNVLVSSGEHARSRSFECSCCPPNILRLFASLGQYIYSGDGNEIAVHLYIQGSARIDAGGENIVLKQETDYPWDGKVAISLQMDKPHKFRLKLRIPGWCRKAGFFVNEEPAGGKEGADLHGLHVQKGYAVLEGEWNCGDRVDVRFYMPVEKVYAHSRVSGYAGRVALQKGPVLYCIEENDNPVEMHRISICENSGTEVCFEKDVLGGINVIRFAPPDRSPFKITAIPYCVWGNRRTGWMTVWIRRG